jgi:septal ring-binding cell division protein DamX
MYEQSTTSGEQNMTTTLYAIIVLFALIVCIAIISIRSSQKHNKTTKLDKELFGGDNEA